MHVSLQHAIRLNDLDDWARQGGWCLAHEALIINDTTMHMFTTSVNIVTRHNSQLKSLKCYVSSLCRAAGGPSIAVQQMIPFTAYVNLSNQCSRGRKLIVEVFEVHLQSLFTVKLRFSLVSFHRLFRRIQNITSDNLTLVHLIVHHLELRETYNLEWSLDQATSEEFNGLGTVLSVSNV